MDATDLSILRHLLRDGRATWADLAVDLGLTAPAIAQRVRRLQERGVIRQFGVWLAPDVVPISAVVGVSVATPDAHLTFQRDIADLEAVQECYQVAGNDDYVLKLRCASLAQLANLVSDVLPRSAGGGRVHSTVILATVKESAVLPLPESEGGAHV
jgi:Lrp/AsnC family transcriptional regulator, leucine-responsive regulatory protein